MSSIPAVAQARASAVLKPSHFRLESVIRPNILSLAPYRCARDDYQDGILLDANENSLGHSLPTDSFIPHTQDLTNTQASSSVDPLNLHRYPNPTLYGIKPTLAKLRGLDGEQNVMLGVGSDEVLDMLQRIAAAPGKDKILICPPTYGMYSVCAAVNDLQVVKVPLDVEAGKFSLDIPKIKSALAADASIKLVFLCSPGNPTGTLIPLSDIRQLLDFTAYRGLIVVDEAYIDFAEEELRLGTRKEQPSATDLIKEYANVVVTQTLSKAFGLAAIRLGICYAQPALIQILNNTKAPYNISVPTAHLASLALSAAGLDRMRNNVRQLITNRQELAQALGTIPATGDILGANDANFVLVQVLSAPREQGGKPDGARAELVYKRMAEEKGLVVRNRSKELGCDGCLRITVGTKEENERCIQLMRDLLR